MAIFSTMVGAVLLSRAVNDEQLSKQFLQAAAKSVLTGSSAAMPTEIVPMTRRLGLRLASAFAPLLGEVRRLKVLNQGVPIYEYTR